MNKSQERVFAYSFGVMFVTAILVLAVALPNPSGFQYEVFKIVLALACAGVAAFIPGFLNVQVSKWVRAGGAIAVFVIIFFFSPARLAVNEPITNTDMLKAIELGMNLEYLGSEISANISYQEGDGGYHDDIPNLIFTNIKMQVISDLEYLGFDRNNEISMRALKELSPLEGSRAARELISRFEGFLEKRSNKLFYLYRASFIAGIIHAKIQKSPEEDVSTQIEELMEYLSWIKENIKLFENADFNSILNSSDSTRFINLVKSMKSRVASKTL